MSTMTVTVHSSNLLSANQRLHWAEKARRTKILRQAGAMNARSQCVPVMERAHLTVFVSWPSRRRRDVSNLAPTIKGIVDGVVQDAKRLPDDDDKHLTGPDLRVTDELSGLHGVTRLRFEWDALEGSDVRPGGAA